MEAYSAPVLETRKADVRFRRPRRAFLSSPGAFFALSEVDIAIRPGESLGVVGESGSGKTTLARLLMGLVKPTAGSVLFRGNDVWSLTRRDRLRMRSAVQIVFQDPDASLDPHMRVGQAIVEPLRALGIRVEPEERLQEVLAAVGMSDADALRYPHEFSGGQRQRIAIARALAPRPDVIIADEPVSSLDVSIQGQILNLLLDLKDDYNLTLLMVSHDLAVVQQVVERVVVMSQGQIVEDAETEAIFVTPRHPYTRRLLDSMLPPP